MSRQLILASASPRRAELLTSAGFGFDVAPAEVDETPHAEEAASDYVIRVARDKARQVAETRKGTVPSCSPRTPRSSPTAGSWASRAATRMPRACWRRCRLGPSGAHRGRRAHGDPRAGRARCDAGALPAAELGRDPWYVATGEPRGKAGAYAIQGHAARFIDWIDGSWSNVVGLPLSTVNRMLKEVGVVD